MGYLKKAAIGITWLGAIRIILRGLGLFKTVIIARFLLPTQFGLFGIASIILGLIEILTETGVNVFLIQEKDKLDKFVDTAWIVSVARGLIIAVLIAVSAPFVASFYKTPSATIVILLIAIVPLIRGFINPAEIKFQKDLEFSKEFFFRTAILIVDALVSVSIVISTHSPMGLVWGMVGGAITELVLSHLLIKPSPKIKFNKQIASDIISRGKWVTSFGIFDYLFTNADNLIVGKIFGIGALGLYDMGYSISILPATEVAGIVSKATFPIYVQISHEVDRLKKAFFKTAGLMLVLGVPVAVIFFLFPEFIIKIVLGNKWLSAAPVLKILALFGLIRAVTGSANAVFLSLKKQNLLALITFVNIFILLATIFPFTAGLGLTGAAYSALLASIISLFVTFYLALKILN